MSTLLFNNIDEIEFQPGSSKVYLDNINKFEDIKFIFPTGRFLRYFKSIYLRNYFKLFRKPVSYYPANTLDDFIKSIYSNNFNDDKQFLDDLTIHGLIELAYEKTDFKYFNLGEKPSQNLIDKLSAIIRGFEKEKVPIDELRIDKKGIINYEQYNDILDLYSNFQKLKADKYITITDAEIAISEKDSLIIDKNKIYYFELFTEFRKPDELFLEKLFDEGLKIIINLDYTENEGPQFDNLRNTVSYLLDSGFKIQNINLESNLSISNLKKYLFSSDNPAEKSKTKISILKSENINSEIENTAKLVKHLHYKDNISLNEIYIFSRNTEKYSDKLRNIFSEAGIPINISDRFKLSKSTIVDSILNLIKIPTFSYNISDIKNVLQNPLFDFEITNEQISGFLNYAKEKRITNIDTKNINSRPHIDPNKNHFNATAKYFKELFLDLEKIDNNKKYNYALNIKLLIKKVNIDGNLLDKKLNEDKYTNFEIVRKNEKNSRALATFLNLLDSASKLWQNIMQGKSFELIDYFKRLKFLVSITKYQIRELYESGVTFTSIEQARGIPKKVSILIGANENEIPMQYKTNKLIGKELQETEFKHYNNERNLFYQFLSNGSNYYLNNNKKLFISYHKEANSSDFTPSNYINELAKLYDYDYSYQSAINNINLFDKGKLFRYNNLDKLENGLIELSKLDNNSINILDEAANKIKSYGNFDQFTDNPFVYFIKTIIDSKKEIELNTMLSPLEKGDIYHYIVEKFYKFIGLKSPFDKKYNSIEDINYPLADLKKEDKEINSSYLIHLLNETLNDNRFSNEFTNLSLDIDLGLNYKTNIFQKWLEKEYLLKEQFHNLFPLLIEKKFEYDIAGIKFRGKVDRVDLLFTDEIYFFIYDYKSGSKIPSKNDILNFESFQMPIYSIAVKEILRKEFGLNAKFGAAIYVLLGDDSDSLKDTFKLRYYDQIFESDLKSLEINDGRSTKKMNDVEIEEFHSKILNQMELINEKIKSAEFKNRDEAKKNYEYDLFIRDYSVF